VQVKILACVLSTSLTFAFTSTKRNRREVKKVGARKWGQKDDEPWQDYQKNLFAPIYALVFHAVLCLAIANHRSENGSRGRSPHRLH